MLPLWRDRVRIVLCRDRLIVVQMQGGSRPRILSKRIFHCADNESGWKAVVALLDGALKSGDLKRADAQVILSNHFVRFLVLPWNEARLTDAEQMALVQLRYSEVYGENGERWEFRISEGPFGAPSMASAIPLELLDRLKSLFAPSPLRLKSVQPYLMTAFNACRNELGNQEGWFVLAERDTFCVGLLREGQWSSIRQRRVVTDWFEEAMLLLEREALLADDGSKRNKVFVCAPEVTGPESAKRGSWMIQRLGQAVTPEIAQAERAHYAMATI